MHRFGYFFVLFLFFTLSLFEVNKAYANNCAVGHASIGTAAIKFTPSLPGTTTLVTASVTANNAQRVDSTITKNGTVIKTQNGVTCSGTTCAMQFSTSGSGTYTVKFNAWDLCGPQAPYNHIALGSVTDPTGATTVLTQVPTSPAGKNVNTTGSIILRFEGIDSQNNVRPAHPTRVVNLYFYSDTSFTNDPTGIHATFGPIKDTVTFSGGSVSDTTNDLFGTFVNTQFKLGSLPTGSYYVLAKSPEGSLRALLSPNKISLTAGKANTLVAIDATNGTTTIPTLLMGDLNNDNVMDINDYAILVDCYGVKRTQSSCTNHALSDATKGLFADLNDDSVVDGIDYNILIRNLNHNGN